MVTNFDGPAAARLARALIHTARDGALGTLDANGYPNASHVATATAIDGAPIVLISQLANHTLNLGRDSRASLLFVSPDVDGDTNTRSRVSVVGEAQRIAEPSHERDRFLRRHPDAELYVDFADFSFWRLVPSHAHIVAGFGQIADVAGVDLLAAADLCETLAGVDSGACAHMNEDHLDALKLMAEVIGGAPQGDWRSYALDPLGIDMANGSNAVRVEYDEPVGASKPLIQALRTLTERARQNGQTI